MLLSRIPSITPNVARIGPVVAHIKGFKSSYSQKKISCVVQTNHINIGYPPDSYYNTKDKNYSENFTSITFLEGSKANVISYYNVNDTHDHHILIYEKPGDYATITVNDKRIPTNIKLTNVYNSWPSAKPNNKSQVVDMSFETHKIKKGEQIHCDFNTYQYKYDKPQNPLIYLCTPIDSTNDGINFRYEYNTRYPYNTHYEHNSHHVYNEEQSYDTHNAYNAHNAHNAHNDEQPAKNRLTLYFNKNPAQYYLIVLYNSEYDIYNCGGSSRQLEIHQISVFN
jgi:hypothetical protein